MKITRIKQIAVASFLAVLLTTKACTRLVTDHQYCEYAAVAVSPELLKFNPFIDREELPKGSFVVLNLNDGEGVETLREAAYVWVVIEHFWELFGTLCVGLFVIASIKVIKTKIRREGDAKTT